MSRVWTDEEVSWLREHYEGSGMIGDTLDAFEREFGRRPTKHSMQQKAWALGLRKGSRADQRHTPATERMRWSDPANADKLAWMLEHDQTESVYVTIDAFEREFGIRLNRNQVTSFRQTRGMLRRRSHGGGREPKPLGSELRRKDGYVYVKVRESPDVPGTRDNWELKSRVVYRQHHGEVPEGHVIFFGDRDIDNFDPDNLVAVPRELVTMLNNPDLPSWHDAETLKAAIAWASLHRAVLDAEREAERTCKVCGRPFRETEAQKGYARRVQTCMACLDAHRRAHGVRRATENPVGTCKVCGREFEREAKSQVRCRECIDRAPKSTARDQRRSERKGMEE